MRVFVEQLGNLTELRFESDAFLTNLLAVNLILAVFNMLPAIPMDGGRVLRAALASQLDYLHATEIAARVGQALESGRAESTVADVMRSTCHQVDDGDMLEGTFERMREGECSTLPVVREGRLVGMITLENVGEWMMIHSALRRTRERSLIDDIYSRA